MELRSKILRRAKTPAASDGGKVYHLPWEKIVLSSALAAVLAVGVTLFSVRYLAPKPAPVVVQNDNEHRVKSLEAMLAVSRGKLSESTVDISNLESTLTVTKAMLADSQGKLSENTRNISTLESTLTKTKAQLADATTALQGMKFAYMTGNAQPSAVAHVFLDLNRKKWYFFTNGMKPPAGGMTYEFWVCVGSEKLPAGTFEVSDTGTATLHGDIPPIPAGANVMLCVTDEPMGGTKVPTGTSQLMGNLE
jgi:hypothetical protein